MTVLRSGSATDVGKVRSSNQDVALEDPDLFAVADGMGGHVGGEVAARVAVDALRAAFQRDPSVEGLRLAVAEANRAVWRQGQAESGLRGMGTTLTATALADAGGGDKVVALANVGDSRAYVFSKGEVIQVTSDHSLAEEKVRQGQLTEAEAAVHPHRHILTRALGVSSDVDVDLWELHLHEGDRILLCSDGLTNEVAVDKIGEVLTRVTDPREAARALVGAAVDHGGSDNVTVVVVDVVSAGTDATAPPRDDRARTGRNGVSQAGAPTAGEPFDGDAMASGHDAPGRADARAHNLRVIGSLGPSALPGREGGEREGDAGGESEGGGRLRPVRAAAIGTKDRPAAARDGGHDAQGPVPGASIRESHLRAAELRRWQPSRRDRRSARHASGVQRLVTFRSALFVLLLLAVVGAAYALVRWYAMGEWFVTVEHNHLAVYQGRPGGFLWFKPQLVDVSHVKTSEVLPSRLATVQRDRVEPSLPAAKRYVANLYQEYCATTGAARCSPGAVSGPSSTSGTQPSATTSTTPASATTATSATASTTSAASSTTTTTSPTTPATPASATTASGAG